ncbi:hypothetical protein NDU88_002310 [Pleurodeles waltl]|uniref:Uncharacterized protein n=1 Tax=Pleurodeles waltl TaxID=8319 RepID=A0AAV7RF30_PLEWA|nr:hypothetical protein NDU88_002310 [Pleurodeles waltl]
MSPCRTGLISTHQLNSVGPPRALYQSRSAYTTPFETTPEHSFQPPPDTTALSFRPGAEPQASPSKISGVGVYNPKVREPDPRNPPAPTPHQSHSRAPSSGVSAGHRQSRNPFTAQVPQHPVPGPTAHSGLQGAPGGLPGSQTLEPRLQGAPGGRPVSLLRQRPTPHRDRAQAVGPSLAPPADAAQPCSDRHHRDRDTRGRPHNMGKASRPPPGWPEVASLGRGGGAQ